MVHAAASRLVGFTLPPQKNTSFSICLAPTVIVSWLAWPPNLLLASLALVRDYHLVGLLRRPTINTT